MQLDRQEVDRRFMPPFNELQFSFQNEPGSGPMWYPAIDGTGTPAEGVQTYTVNRNEVDTLVCFTDGFQPKGKQVRGLDDLEP